MHAVLSFSILISGAVPCVVLKMTDIIGINAAAMLGSMNGHIRCRNTVVTEIRRSLKIQGSSVDPCLWHFKGPFKFSSVLALLIVELSMNSHQSFNSNGSRGPVV